jgi:succinyl-CoA synthetase alpha subunit
MSILINNDTKVIVQGITGKEGQFHTRQMLDYGTKIVAGVTPHKGGSEVQGLPVFDTVEQAVLKTKAEASIIFVPALSCADAIFEAIDSGIKIIVCITEGIPVHDMVKVIRMANYKNVTLIGPNSPGLISVGEAKLGIMPGNIFTPGPVALLSRSGTLTYQVVDELTKAGLGQTSCIGVGGDPLIGTPFIKLLPLLKKDKATKAVVIIGEIGGSDEEEAAAYLAEHKLPAVAFVAGRTAPEGKKMGHAGAIISGGKGTAEAKVEAFNRAKVPVATSTSDIITKLKKILK